MIRRVRENLYVETLPYFGNVARIAKPSTQASQHFCVFLPNMRIAVLSHLKFPIAQPFNGGVESFVHRLCHSLADRGHEVSLLASGDSDSALNLVPITPVATVPSSMELPEERRGEWIYETERDAFRKAFRILYHGNYDVIHNCCLSSKVMRLSHHLGKPFLTTLHIPPGEDYRLDQPHLQNTARVRYAAISESNRDAWFPYVGGQSLVRNGVPRPASGSALVPADEIAGAFWFGRIHPDKGVHLAIQAAALAGMRLRFAGPVPDQKYFAETVSPLIRDGVEYLGHLDGHGIAEELGRAAVSVVTPLWDEPFGLVVAESLAMGAPVAAFRRGAIPEILCKASGRIVAPGCVESLARAMLECTRLSRADCRQRFETHFSQHRMILQYEEIYKAMADYSPSMIRQSPFQTTPSLRSA